MNDFYKGVILSLLRKAMTGVSVWLVTNGWLNEGQTTEIVLGASLLLASTIASIWSQYGAQVVKLAALTPGISTLDEAKALAKMPSAPAVTTPSDAMPAAPATADVQKAKGVTSYGGGAGLLIFLALSASLAACNRPITPADGAATTKDVLTLANDVHRAVFDGYVAGTVPGAQADPIMNAVEQGLIPAARKTVAALRAWQAATTTDLKKIRAGDLSAALDLLQGSLTSVLGVTLPAGVADSVQGTATSIRNIIDTLRKAIADARADASSASTLALA